MNAMDIFDISEQLEQKKLMPLLTPDSSSNASPFLDLFFEKEISYGSNPPNFSIFSRSTEESDNLLSSSSSLASISPLTLAPQTSVTRKRKSIQESHQKEPTPQNFSSRVLKSSNKTVSCRSFSAQFFDQGFICPDDQYTPSGVGYTPSDGEYTSFDDEYTSSDDEYTSSDDEYTSSDGEYTSSDDEYTSSDQETSAPKQQLSKLSQKFSSEQPRKKRKVDTKNLPANVYFTIACTYCPDSPELSSFNRNDSTHNFKKHMKGQHPEISPDNTEKYINDNLQKPGQLLQFLLRCPECKQKICTSREPQVKQSLFKHMFKTKKHLNEKGNHTKKSLEKYINDNLKVRSIPNPKRN